MRTRDSRGVVVEVNHYLQVLGRIHAIVNCENIQDRIMIFALFFEQG